MRFFAREPIVPRPSRSGRFSPPCQTGRQSMTRADIGSFIAASLRRRSGPDAQPARDLVGIGIPTALMGFTPFAALLPEGGCRRFRRLNPHAVRRLGPRRLLFFAAGGRLVLCRNPRGPPWPVCPGFWVFHRPSRTARLCPPGHDQLFPMRAAVAACTSVRRSLLPWALPLPGFRASVDAPAGSRHLGRPSASGILLPGPFRP